MNHRCIKDVRKAEGKKRYKEILDKDEYTKMEERGIEKIIFHSQSERRKDGKNQK